MSCESLIVQIRLNELVGFNCVGGTSTQNDSLSVLYHINPERDEPSPIEREREMYIYIYIYIHTTMCRVVLRLYVCPCDTYILSA